MHAHIHDERNECGPETFVIHAAKPLYVLRRVSALASEQEQ